MFDLRIALFLTSFLIIRGKDIHPEDSPQDFCESFRSNSYRIIIHSHDFENFLLIIKKYFWILSPTDNQLVFDRKNKLSVDSFDRWLEHRFSFAFAIRGDTDTSTHISLFRVFIDLKTGFHSKPQIKDLILLN